MYNCKNLNIIVRKKNSNKNELQYLLTTKKLSLITNKVNFIYWIKYSIIIDQKG